VSDDHEGLNFDRLIDEGTWSVEKATRQNETLREKRGGRNSWEAGRSKLVKSAREWQSRANAGRRRFCRQAEGPGRTLQDLALTWQDEFVITRCRSWETGVNGRRTIEHWTWQHADKLLTSFEAWSSKITSVLWSLDR